MLDHLLFLGFEKTPQTLRETSHASPFISSLLSHFLESFFLLLLDNTKQSLLLLLLVSSHIFNERKYLLVDPSKILKTAKSFEINLWLNVSSCRDAKILHNLVLASLFCKTI